MNYHEYIQSKGWSDKRAAYLWLKFRGNPFRCDHCGVKGPVEVHHKTYERLGRELNDDLAALCRTCHEHFHLFGKLPREIFRIPAEEDAEKRRKRDLKSLKRQRRAEMRAKIRRAQRNNWPSSNAPKSNFSRVSGRLVYLPKI